jgi:hypothetical protein
MSAKVPLRDRVAKRPKLLAILVAVLVGIVVVLSIWGPALGADICRGYQDLLSGTQGLPTDAQTEAVYDEQVSLIETVSSPTLETNVTVSSSTDSDGYGPGFLLNGLTESGYWYQTGVAFNWPRGSSGHASGPAFFYDVLAPNGNALVIGLQRIQLNSGNHVQILLRIQRGSVVMQVQNSQTCVSAADSYSAFGATEFQSSGTTNGFFSGVMTEWWHAVPYQGPTGNATFTIPGASSPSAEIGVDEIAPSSAPQNAFGTVTDVTLGAPGSQSGSYMGATAVVDGTSFETG